MTTPEPELSPEGRLIEAARLNRSPILSIRKASAEAGISDAWWRQIVNGYRTVKGGDRIGVDAPVDTLAAMAQVVGVTPAQLREIGRTDAARSLEMLQQSAPDVWDGDLSVVPDDDLLDEVGRRLQERAQDTSTGRPKLGLVARQVSRSDPSTFDAE